MSRRIVTLASVFTLACAIVPSLPSNEVHAIGPVSLTALDTPYEEHFDTLPVSGSLTTWTNNSTIPGWFHARTGTGTTIVANNGSSNTGNLYSYGATDAPDRALGSVGSTNAAAGNFYWGVRLSNDTGSTITSLDVSYTGEQWRNSAAVAQTVSFSYLVGSPAVTGSLAEFQAGGVGVTTLDFTAPITGGNAGALDGNLAVNSVDISSTITGLNIPAGTEVMLQWSDPDHSSSDHGLAIDDFSVTPHTGELPPEPDLCADPITRIHALQGSGFSTPAPGTIATRGIVVGDFETAAAQGFYIQDPDPDADPSTSEGILVFTGSSDLVNVGDAVGVSGFVRERFNQTAIQGSNSNTAAVPATNIAICSTGNSLPPATAVNLPYSAATLLEPYEGMRVVFPQPLVISEYFNYDQFGEIVLARPLDGEARPFTGTAIDEPGAAANARTTANALSRITLDDNNGASNPPVLRHPNGGAFSLTNRFRGGDLVTGAIGVLGYDFNAYRIYPTAAATYTEVNPRPPAPAPLGGSLHVAAMNTLNYFLTPDYPNSTPPNPLDNKCGPLQTLECRGADFDQPTEFSRQRTKLLAALSGLAADVIGLNELENSPGVDPVEDIASGLNELLGDGTYAAIDTGVIGTDAIKVGLIYKPDSVTPIGSFETLTSADDPRFIDTRSRPTLAQTFEQNSTGERFTIAVNHLKSKGSACAGDPDVGDGQGNCNVTRTSAAQALVDWLATDPTGSGDPDFLIMGDLNSYAQEDPIDAVEAGADDTAGTDDDFVNLIAEYQGAYAYSYTFDGQAGYLDHALANADMAAQIVGAEDWHINSDEPDVVDYDTTFKPPAQEALYEPNGSRSSDHDPVMVGLNLDSDTPPAAAVTNGACVNSNDARAQLTVTLTDPDSTDLQFELASNGNTGLVPNANIIVSGSGTQRTIAIAAVSKRSGAATLTFEVSDATSIATLVVTLRIGTDVDETLTGTEGSDLILGLGGRDTINALGGGDVLCGANGDDALDGGEGSDVLAGGKGSDALTGGAGADAFSGGAGADVNTDFDAAAGDTSDGS